MDSFRAAASHKGELGVLALEESGQTIRWHSTHGPDGLFRASVRIPVASVSDIYRERSPGSWTSLEISFQDDAQVAPSTLVFIFRSSSAERELKSFTKVLIDALRARRKPQKCVKAVPTSSGLLLSKTPLAKANIDSLDGSTSATRILKPDDVSNGDCERRTCPNFVERSKYTYALNDHFQDSERFHGARSSRVLLWGLGGGGKRQLVTDFALKHAVNTCKTVLWIEAWSVESFIRDYRHAFHKLTGSAIPKGLDIFQLLRKIRRELDARHNEWILVLFDVGKFFTNPNNSLGTTLLNHLPDAGNIIATTSRVIVEQGRLPQQISCGIDLIDFVPLQVKDWTKPKACEYLESRGLGGFYHKVQVNPLMATLTCSNALHSDLPMDIYKSCLKQTLVRTGALDQPEIVRTMSPALAVVLEMSWNTLRSQDAAAIDLLCYLTVVSSTEVPISLLYCLRRFKGDSSDRMDRAIALLSSMGLMSRNGNRTIIMHGVIKRMLRLKLTETYGARYSFFVCDWIVALKEQLTADFPEENLTEEDPEDYQTDDDLAKYEIPLKLKGKPEDYWQLLPHLQSVTRLAFKYQIKGDSLLALLHNTALFMVEDKVFYSIAETLITYALSRCWSSMSRNMSPAQLYRYLPMKELRIRARLRCFKYLQAEADVRECQRRLNRSDLQGAVREKLMMRFNDYGAEFLMEIHDYSAAESLLSYELHAASLEPTRPLDFEEARRQYRLAKCLRKLGSNVDAIKHSHLCLTYWSTCVNKWDDQEMLKWVDEHSCLLVLLGKRKGAYQYLRPLLDRYLDLYDHTNEKVWQKVYLAVVSCRGNVNGLKEAEDILLRVLSTVSVEDLKTGPALNACLWTLNCMGDLLGMAGREIEAEALYRHNVRIASDQVQSDSVDEALDGIIYDRLDLIASLEEQGKLYEAFLCRKHFHRMGWDDDMEEALRTRASISRREWFLYIQAFEALRSGNQIQLVPNFGSSDQECLDTAISRIGSLEERLQNDLHPFHDLDIYGLSHAKKSRLLHQLGLDVVYNTFSDREQARPLVFAKYDQTLIPQYSRAGFNFCECRRSRQRSQSLAPVDLIHKRFLLADDPPKPGARTYRQTKITDWLVPISSTKQMPTSSAPSWSRTTKDSSGYAAYKSLLLNSKDYTTQAPQVQDSLVIDTSMRDVILVDKAVGTITWVPAAFSEGDHEDENYIMSNIVDVPSIKIHMASSENPEAELAIAGIVFDDNSKQKKKMTDFFKAISKSKSEEGEASAWAGPHRLDDILEDSET